MEKELSTPEYYPLSLNALVNACNQKSSRDPVVSYDEKTVASALLSLKEKQLVYEAGGSRVPKFGNNLSKVHSLLGKETALLCLLMLRGPQTTGELRARAERLQQYENAQEGEQTIADLAEMKLVTTLPRQPGRKEPRHAHLLSGAPRGDAMAPLPSRAEPAMIEAQAEADRLAQVEQGLATLRQEVTELKQAFLDFKRQFE
jgi:uncharacterized protein YceH (UPF0502 family)